MFFLTVTQCFRLRKILYEKAYAVWHPNFSIILAPQTIDDLYVKLLCKCSECCARNSTAHRTKYTEATHRMHKFTDSALHLTHITISFPRARLACLLSTMLQLGTRYPGEWSTFPLQIRCEILESVAVRRWLL